MQRKRYLGLGWHLALWALATCALTALAIGGVRLVAPLIEAEIVVALQDDTLLDEARVNYPELDLSSNDLMFDDALLRSSDALQAAFLHFRPGDRRALVESGDGWALRLRERSRAWACGQGISSWSIGGTDPCSWLGGRRDTGFTPIQHEILNDRLSLASLDDGRLVSIRFRAAERDAAVVAVKTLSDRMIAEREAATETLRRTVAEHIEAERMTVPDQLPVFEEASVEDKNTEERRGDSLHTEGGLLQKLVGAIEAGDEKLKRHSAIKRHQASLINSLTDGIVIDPTLNNEFHQQIADMERDRILLSHELSSLKQASDQSELTEAEKGLSKDSEGAGQQILPIIAQPVSQGRHVTAEPHLSLTKADYDFLIHAAWAKPAALRVGEIKVSTFSLWQAGMVAVTLALSAVLILALSLMAGRHRSKRCAEMVEAAFYNDPSWPHAGPMILRNEAGA